MYLGTALEDPGPVKDLNDPKDLKDECDGATIKQQSKKPRLQTKDGGE
jgi:hypothetical protein